MATLLNNCLTLADWASRQKDDQVADIIELQSQTNEILLDMLWLEANGPTTHETTVRTGLPSGVWRSFYQGVPPAKSTTAKVTESMGQLEALSPVDKDLCELNGNSAAFRMSEDAAYLEGLGQDMATAFFYGDIKANAAKFNGLAPRFSTLDKAKAGTAANVIDAGGTGATNTSIWLVGYGQRMVHGLFPKGAKAGLQMIDLGEEPMRDADGNEFRALKTRMLQKAGLAVRDWRHVVRSCNIDVTAIKKDAATGPDLCELLTRMVHRPPVTPKGVGPIQSATNPKMRVEVPRFAFYCNRDILTAIDLQAQYKKNALIKIDEWDGQSVVTYRGIPLRNCDVLRSDEARVV